jgi:hypothetical protein
MVSKTIEFRGLNKLWDRLIKIDDNIKLSADKSIQDIADKITVTATENISKQAGPSYTIPHGRHADDKSLRDPETYRLFGPFEDELGLVGNYRVLSNHAAFVEFGTGRYTDFSGLPDDAEEMDRGGSTVQSESGRYMWIHFKPGSCIYNNDVIKVREVKGQPPKFFLRNAIFNPTMWKTFLEITKANILAGVVP